MDRPSGILRRLCEKAGIPEFFEEIANACPDMDSRGHNTFREAQRICYAFPWHEWVALCEKPFVPNPFSSRTGGLDFRHRGERLQEFVPPPRAN